MRKLLYILVAIISIMAFSSSSFAKSAKIDGTINLNVGSVAAGIGWSWGGGVMTYEGVEHNFDISGLSLADVGISKFSASGIVYNLKELKDFEGTYYGVKTGVTLAGGKGAIALKNNHGVVLELNGTGEGLKFALGTQGVTIKLKD
ncbi:MAG: hypothetical protein Q8L79_14485 [Methylobacter sp.]|uniref:hypothetical protein n=1 Tax=Methylobacter sp. TaxID=2051955 RepID=UPI00272FAAA9|nr:hypothetical protein [Methylobacter sp.]MDP1666316.1 hypothetical protein [Methylobacter sp.]